MSAFLDLLLTPDMAIALGFTIVAGLMRGYAGFGTAILLSPVYSTLWGPRAGVPIMLLMELIVSIQLVPRAFRAADKRVILPIGLAASLATPFGAYVLFVADGELLRRCIGALVLVFGLLLMSGWRYHGNRPTALNMLVGLASGLMKGSTGMSGPPVILYLLAGPEDAARHRSNLILFFGLISIISVVFPLLGGLYDTTVLLRTVVLLPVMAACVPVGARLFHVVPVKWYRKLALVFLLMAGAFALIG